MCLVVQRPMGSPTHNEPAEGRKKVCVSHRCWGPGMAAPLTHPRPTPTKPTGDSPISSLVSNLELMATWSLPRPMIWRVRVKML